MKTIGSMEETLPMEVKMIIFEYLSVVELNNLRTICKEWNDTLCSSKCNLIWSDLINNLMKGGKLLFIPNDDGKIVQLTNIHLRKLAKLLYLKQQSSLHLYNLKRQIASKPQQIIEDPPSDNESDELDSNDDDEISTNETQETNIEKVTDFFLIPQKEFLTEDNDQIQNNTKEKTLLARGLEASTVDNTSQDIDCTRDVRNRRKFWSSTGSKTTQANEHLIYQFQDPWFVVERERKLAKLKSSTYGYLDILHKHVNTYREENPIDDLDYINQFSNIGILYLEKMSICPFVASWQSNNCYSPKFVTLSIGKSSDKNSFIKITQEIPIEQNGTYQQFALGPLVIIYERSLNSDNDDLLVKSKAPIVQEEVRDNMEDEEDFETEDEEDEEGGQGRIMISVEDAMLALEASGGVFNERFMEVVQQLVRDRMKMQQKEQEENKMFSQLDCRENGDMILRADLIGKVQTQPLDNLYYTCLEYFDVSGSAFTL